MGKKARVLHYTLLERIDRHKHTSLLDPLIIYKEHEVLWVQIQNPDTYTHKIINIWRLKL